MLHKAAFLDRDGVINVPEIRGGKSYAPTRLEDFVYYDDVADAMRLLKAAGYLIVVVTNQPDLTTGKITPDVLDAMHRRLIDDLPVDAIKVCPHVESDQCACRKPRPGMLEEAARELGIDPAASVMVGDRWRDILAGQQFGCYTIYLPRGHMEEHSFQPDEIASSLAGAVKSFLARKQPKVASMNFADITTKIFADGADLDSIKRLAANPIVKGFTTNPTLMRKAGVTDYKAFAKQVLEVITDRPVSFEVFADDLQTMEKQALEIASWGENVNVKIPVTNTKGEFVGPILRTLSERGVKLNVTAIFTLEQVRNVVDCLRPDVPSFVSVFAGRIADAGIDPVPVMAESVQILKQKPASELIWASPREVLNVVQASQVGCQVITVTPDILGKLSSLGKDLAQFSLETVEMFYRDATASAFSIPL